MNSGEKMSTFSPQEGDCTISHKPGKILAPKVNCTGIWFRVAVTRVTSVGNYRHAELLVKRLY